jgi:hypothetical protein
METLTRNLPLLIEAVLHKNKQLLKNLIMNYKSAQNSHFNEITDQVSLNFTMKPQNTTSISPL